MKQKLLKIINDKYVRNSSIFFLGSLLVAFINYLYYPILSRLLSIQQFGEAQTLMTLILQSMVILNAFGYVAVHTYTNIKDEKVAAKKIKSLEGSALYITALTIIFVLLVSPQINAYLKFDNNIPLIAICVFFLINIFFTIRNSWLQARHRFVTVSIGGAISAIGKLVFAIAFISLGWKIFGVALGLILATLLSLAYVIFKSEPGFKISAHLTTNYFRAVASDRELRKDLFFGLLIFITLISVTLLYSSDVIFIRRFSNETISGMYSGIASIARIIFFATLAFSAVLLPSIKIGENKSNRANLLKAIVITTIIGGVGLLGFVLLPKLTVTILIGKKYLPLAPLLPKVGLFVLLASITNVLLTYIVALRKKAAAAISLMPVLFLIFFVYSGNKSVEGIINTFIIINIFALLLAVGYLMASSSVPQKSS